jgi:two-component system response regulator DctR
MRYRVLICEDDPMVVSINEKYLSCLEGFEVAGRFPDGAALLDAFSRSGWADLILLDLFLPGMDGLEALRQLRFRGYEGDVIVLTSGNRIGLLRRVFCFGVLDYLVKPYTFERFSTALALFRTFRRSMDEINRSPRLTQELVDGIMLSSPGGENADVIRKGIQDATLRSVLDALRGGEALSSDDIVARTSLSQSTVRRYVAHLTQMGRIVVEFEYRSAGRPVNRYRLTP